MSRRKSESTTPKPEKVDEPISLRRLEERIERVPITAEQARERMSAAAATLVRAATAEAELRELKDEVKAKAAEADSLHAEADRIVLDAHTGTVAAPFPVIVERHPVRAHEMIVWRVPDGIAGADLLAAELPEGEARIAAREAQGCFFLEARAMAPDELEVARAEDERRRNPLLPGLDGPPPAKAEVGAPDEVPAPNETPQDDGFRKGDPALTVICPECASLPGDPCIGNGHITETHGARIMAAVEEPREEPAAKRPEILDEARNTACSACGAPAGEDCRGDNGQPEPHLIHGARLIAAGGGKPATLASGLATSSSPAAGVAPPNPAEAGPTTSSGVLCPAVLEQATDPLDDRVCGKPGSRRSRGLCEEHKGAAAATISQWTARRDMRRTARAQAARAAALAEREDNASAVA